MNSFIKLKRIKEKDKKKINKLILYSLLVHYFPTSHHRRGSLPKHLQGHHQGHQARQQLEF
jgi:hypothetical protein